MRSVAVLLLSACVMQGAWAQAITGKGFLPDENGTNLDDPQAKTMVPIAGVTSASLIKDCAECPEMVVLPSGSFLMGSPPETEPDPFSNQKQKSVGDPYESPQHRVQIQRFAIGKYEITQEQWYAVMGNNPSSNKGRTLPVEEVSWDAVQRFIAKLILKTGQKYRLPTEAEWEYAARAGTTTEWSHGNDESKLGDFAWFGDNSGGKTQVVGQKMPNAFGLFDMNGNVFEWTQDCWHDNYVGAPKDGSAWVTSCSGNHRVLRGGSCINYASILRSASRFWLIPDFRNCGIGFRLARDL